MQIVMMESTEKIVQLENVECRVWDGRTADGIKVAVFVHRIVVRGKENQAQFQRELEERPEPVTTVPLRHLL